MHPTHSPTHPYPSRFLVRVPRCVYINADVAPNEPAAAGLGTPVRVSLPFGDQPHHVYKVGGSAWQQGLGGRLYV